MRSGPHEQAHHHTHRVSPMLVVMAVLRVLRVSAQLMLAVLAAAPVGQLDLAVEVCWRVA